MHLQAERAKKLHYKSIWTIRSLIARSRIEQIYARSVTGNLYSNGIEYVCRSTTPAYIEPDFGYVITTEGRLIEQALIPNAAADYTKPPWRVGTPSPYQFFAMRRGAGFPALRYPRVISLRHFWDWNYYHFYMDVLGKLTLFDSAGVSPSTPIVIGRYAIQQPFVRQILNEGKLKNRNWIILDDAYVLADEVMWCRSMLGYKNRMDYILDLMEIPRNHDNRGDRRIFLNRPPLRRSILNFDELAPVIREHGFEVVDSENMSIRDQIDLFSNTRYLVAIHGAGLVNMMFRRDSPMSIIEIHPENYVSRDFKNMSQEWGFKLERVVGKTDGNRDPYRANLRVDPGVLQAKISEMLKAS